MLDNLKLFTENQDIINRLAGVQGFEHYQHRNNNYTGLCKYGQKIKLDFRKVFVNGKLEGFRHLEISISPHYHFNSYLHNGNDFTPENCIKTIPDILTYLGIEPQEYDLLKVVNIEFGLNLIPETDIKNLINGILYSKKTAFVVPNPKTPYFKITDATTYKQIKAYDKGLQFAGNPLFRINLNTFRFEVKSKKSANIKKYGINTTVDLLKLETYQRLGQEILDEWDKVLILNLDPDFSNLKTDEVAFITKANEVSFWSEIIQPKYRNKFGRYKEKYHKILKGKNNLHTLIKGQIIDKLIYLSSGANFPQKNPINKGKQCFEETTLKEINGQSAPLQQNTRLCLVTKLDISMQRKGSKFLCSAGLKYYKENEPKTYELLNKKYLTDDKRKTDLKTQFYYLAHNIRNLKTNPNHNPKYSRQRFDQRNYHPDQLQLPF